MRAPGIALAWLVLIAVPVRAMGQIPCLTWCQQCSPGPECTADCLLQNQPMRDAGCSASKGIPCYDWCVKCKPTDTACPGRCDKQGKPLMIRSCPTK